MCKASKSEAIVELLRILSNAAYGSLRFAHRVKIVEKKRDKLSFYHISQMHQC